MKTLLLLAFVTVLVPSATQAAARPISKLVPLAHDIGINGPISNVVTINGPIR